MKRIAFFILIVIVSTVSALSQSVIGKEINDRDVEWADYNGEINHSSPFAAETYWAVTYKFPPPKVKDGKVYLKVETHLYLRSTSWVKPNRQTQRLLEHEQGHFRIGRICTEEFRKTADSTAFDLDNYAKEIDAIYWTTIKKYQNLTKQYDLETDHYRNIEEQARWNKKLDDLLK